MNSNDTRPRGPRRNNGGRRRPPQRDSEPRREQRAEPPKKRSFWQKLLGVFGLGSPKKSTPPQRSDQSSGQRRPQGESRRAAPPERVEVTSPKLYIGNLSYDATESDLSELFNGVGKVQNAEIVTHKDTYRSKGFGFVTMMTTDEAVRAVATLHDKEFMGRKLVVSGSRTDSGREPRA